MQPHFIAFLAAKLSNLALGPLNHSFDLCNRRLGRVSARSAATVSVVAISLSAHAFSLFAAFLVFPARPARTFLTARRAPLPIAIAFAMAIAISRTSTLHVVFAFLLFVLP